MATLSIKVNQDCQLVNNDDRVALKNKYTMMTIIGIKTLQTCEDVTHGVSDTAWGKLSHIRNRSTPQEVRQADFIKQHGGAFVVVRF
jgi:hypothetical protein